MIILSLSFFLIATIYSIAGFGGGSSYIAFLALFHTPYEIIPIVALVCNLVVVSVGSYNYKRAGHLRWSLLIPFLISSVPTAYFGGKLYIPERLFYILLFLGLAYSSIYLWLPSKNESSPLISIRNPNMWFVAVPAGILMGGMAGLIGIGGGIFLSPLLHVLKWADSKKIAAASSMFILLNSISGLTGQLQKSNHLLDRSSGFFILPLMAFAGGMVGSHWGSRKASFRHLKHVTAILVLYVTIRIGLKVFR